MGLVRPFFFHPGEGERADLLRLLAIGIGVQFAWEAVLLLASIRPPGLRPLIVDSLLETNLGLPYFYLIHRAVNHKSLHSHKDHV